MNIYVGNIAFDATDDDLRALFEEHGEVTSSRIIKDRYSGNSRGFGFVEMSDDEKGKTAIEKINGFDFMGRSLKVNEARPRTDRPRERR